MTEIYLNPPQPIPYPDSWLLKQFYRSPLLLYRLNLGKLFARYILILSTRGRKTKQVHRTPVEYFKQGNRIYIISGFDQQPDWFQNIQTDPRVILQTHSWVMHAVARSPNTDQEWRDVVDYLKHSPIVSSEMKKQIEDHSERSIIDQIKSWPVLTFDPLRESGIKPLAADLSWVWPIILLVIAVKAIVLWLFFRNKSSDIF